MINSNSVNSETYRRINIKKREYESLKVERDDLIREFEQKHEFLLKKYELKAQINCYLEQIKELKNELTNMQEKINQDKLNIKKFNKQIKLKYDSIREFKDKIGKTRDFIKRLEKLTNNKQQSNDLYQTKLSIAEEQKKRIKELNNLIFNLALLKPKDEDNLQMSATLRNTLNASQSAHSLNLNALHDARMTTYINGRWMVLPNDPFNYMIVKSKLPSNGDYSAFYKEMEISKTDKKLSVDDQLWLSADSNRAEIQSALTYTTQFVNLVAFYLNILLPYNLPHNKFCSQTLTQAQFTNSVAKLNVNIIYLCLSQRVPVNNLLPKHTLENLYHFLDYFANMKIKVRDRLPIVFPNEILSLLDEMFDKNSADDLNFDYIPNIPLNDCEEWEKLPNSDEIPMDPPNPSVTSSKAGGLIASSTSLISSVTHFFTKHLVGGNGGGGATGGTGSGTGNT